MPGPAWPEGVIARYLTKAAEIVGEDITIDVVQDDDRMHAICRGCGLTHADESNYQAVYVHRKAQAHAETCRGMLRPTA
ncbi:hypothetical protein [Streptomyces virginiae]